MRVGTDFSVVYLDNHLLVVNKPAGLLSQADRTGDVDLLSLAKAFIKERFNKPGNVYLGLVHRLDRPASGVMVLARTSKAAGRLTAQFKQRTVDKRYLALVEGTLQGAGRCVDYLVKENQQVRVVEASYPSAKRAGLSWEALASGSRCTLVRIQLETGRAHQIRVQLAHRGFPLVGDMRYGGTQELDGRNLALHSYRLTLEHPTLREAMTWVTPPPATWKGWFDEAIAQLLSESSPDQS